MKRYFIKVNQNQYEVEVVEVKTGASVETNMASVAPKIKTALSTPKAKETTSQNGKKIVAPMPGNVIKVLVSAGDQVKKEQKLLVFESMKMQNDLTSPFEGTVTEVNTSEGSVMAAGELLIVIN